MNTSQRLGMAIVVAGGISAVGAIPAIADAIYTYTGNHYSFAHSPYLITEFVTVTLDYSFPLAPNLSQMTETPQSYNFTDGVQTLTPSNSTIDTILLTTSATGQITNWYVSAIEPPSSIDNITTANLIFNGILHDTDTVYYDGSTLDTAYNASDPGTQLHIRTRTYSWRRNSRLGVRVRRPPGLVAKSSDEQGRTAFNSGLTKDLF